MVPAPDDAHATGSAAVLAARPPLATGPTAVAAARPAPATRRRPVVEARAAAVAAADGAGGLADTSVPAAGASATDASAPSAGLAATAGPGDDEPPPVYRTRLPPTVTLRYDVRRGLADGSADLRWRRDAEGYALDWQVQVGGAAVLTQSSRGGFDAAGVAPLRFVDQRPSRAAAAANFRRDLGRITFSRKAADALLLPGAQDRLSWLLQLAAIVAAEPELRRDGAEVLVSVAGATGEVALWRFRFLGLETVATEAGETAALHYLRQPRGPYETRAEVWLDAAGDDFLPLQANWKSGPADEGLELRLRRASGVVPE